MVVSGSFGLAAAGFICRVPVGEPLFFNAITEPFSVNLGTFAWALRRLGGKAAALTMTSVLQQTWSRGLQGAAGREGDRQARGQGAGRRAEASRYS